MRLLTSAAAIVAALSVPAPALGWSWPVHGSVLTFFSFDYAHPYTAGQHRGIDIGAPTGTGVEAPVSGSVAFAGSVPVNGKVVTIATPDGYSVTLVHLGSYSVRRGETVSEGSIVGSVGPSGGSELPVPFVHLGVRLAADPQGYLDPLSLLPPQAPPAPPDPGPTPDPAPAPDPAPSPGGGPVPPVAAPPPPPAPGPVPGAQPPGLVIAVARSPVAMGRPHARSQSGPTSAGRATATSVRHTGARERSKQGSPASERTGGRPRSRVLTWGLPDRAPVASVLHDAELPVRETSGAVPPSRRRAPGDGIPAALSAEAGLLAALLAAAALALRRKRGRRARTATPKAVRIIDRDALLRDDTDLLRQRDAAHRPRVHDACRRRGRAASPAARRGDLLPHRDRRARLEGATGRRGAGPRPQGLRRRHRREALA
jgi:hypothetical protein